MAKFENGHKKLGGRKAGTLNKKTSVWESLDEITNEDGEPIDILKMLFDALFKLKPGQRVGPLLHLLGFLYAKPKCKEESPEDKEIRLVIQDYTSNKVVGDCPSPTGT